MLRYLLYILILFSILSLYSLVSLQEYNSQGYVNYIDSLKHCYNKELHPLLCVSEVIDYDDIYYKRVYKEFFRNEIVGDYYKRDFILDSDPFLFMFINNKIQMNDLFISNTCISYFKTRDEYPLTRCIHIRTIILTLDGESIIYLFNPKHIKDITTKKSNQGIKKWGHKISIHKNDILIIPPNWYYIQETSTKCLQITLTYDSVISYIPTMIKYKLLQKEYL
jgi:hypothetical protein